MNRHAWIYRLFNIAALVSMLFGVLPPVWAAPIAQSEAVSSSLNAPSELSAQWPAPEAPEASLPYRRAEARSQPLTGLETTLAGMIPDLDRFPAGSAVWQSLESGVADQQRPYVGQQMSGPGVSQPSQAINDSFSFEPPWPVRPKPLDKILPAGMSPDERINGLQQSGQRDDPRAFERSGAPGEETENALVAAKAGPVINNVSPPTISPNPSAATSLNLGQTSILTGTGDPVTNPDSGSQKVHLPLIVNNSDGSSGSVPADTVEVSPAGGTLVSTDDVVKVMVPAGAVETAVLIRYQPSLAAQGMRAPGTNLLQTFSLEAEQLSDGAPVHTFRTPIQIQLKIRETQLTTDTHFYVGTWKNSRWEALPTTFDPDTQTVTAQTYHFSAFGLISTQATLGSVLLAATIPGTDSISRLPHTFYQNTVTFNYTGGPVALSSTPDGSGTLLTDDAVLITVTRPDGTAVSYTKDYRIPTYPYILATPPQDITAMFQPGDNTVQIELIDYEAPFHWTQGYYLVGTTVASDTIPPVIHWVDRWLDGNTGQAVIQARVTDNIAVADVALTFNGNDIPMTPIGGDLYEAVVSVPPNALSRYLVVAIDTAFNVAVFPPNGQLDVRGYLSRRFGWHLFKDACPPGPCGSEGDPVNTSNGNFTYYTTDLTVSGVGQTDLVIERGYNSLANETQGIIRYTLNGDTVVADPFDVHPEPFGPGWTFPFAIHLLFIDNTLFQGIQVRYPDGHTVNFRDNGDGTFSPVQPRSFDELMTDSSGYVLKQKDLTRFYFDPNGKLTAIVDRNGNTSALSYSGDQLIAVTNASGRTVTFEYNGQGLISDIHAPEGRHLQYGYTNGLLTAFTDGENHTTGYQYDAAGRLTAIVTPKGHPSMQLVYDAELGRVVEQTIGATERRTFAYDDVNRETTITDVLNNQTIHVYDDQYRLVEVRDALNYSEYFDYDADENRTYHQDRQGREWFSTFDDRGNRLTEDGPLGWRRVFEYNGLDLVTRLTEQVDSATSRSTDFGYDANGNLTGMTNAAGDSSAIQYDSRGLPTNIFDFNDHETVNSYDPATGDLIKSRNAEGDTVTYGYDDLGRLVSMTNGRGFSYTYAYDQNDNLRDIDGPLGYHLGYRYDANNNLVREIDANGGEIDYFYDASENPIRVENQLDFPTSFGYDAMNNLIRLEDAEARVWTYDYDAVYNRLAEHGPEDTHTFYSYNPMRKVTGISRCNSSDCSVAPATGYAYDDLDRLTDVTNPEGHRVQFEYDLAGNLRQLTDARLHQTRFTYDLLDRLTLKVDALSGEWRYEYDDEGNVLREIDANQHANNSYSYDKANRRLTSTDAEGYLTTFAYDANGNVVTVTDGNGHLTTYVYDELDRLSAVTNAEGETTAYRYDLAGNQTSLIEADGLVTRYEYDALFRLTGVIQNYRPAVAKNADTNVDTRYSYDKVGNLLSMLNAEDHPTHFYYDGLDRLIQEVDAEGNTWDYEYDRLGNRTARIDANRQRTDYSYYPDNQLQQVDYADGSSVAYTYDQNNNRLTMTDRLGATTWVYDPLNRVTGVTDALNRHLGYSYDAVGNRTGITYPDNRTVTYAYYDNNWLNTVTDPAGNVTRYERDGVGQTTRTLNPNSTTAEASYDQANRLLTLRTYQVGGAGKTINSFAYTYDEVGQRTQMVAEYGWRNPPVVTSDYTYDGLRRLIRDADSEGVWTDYSFDRVGNRLTLATNDDSQSPRPFDDKTLYYSYNAINQVLTVMGDTHPGQPQSKREDNVGQAIHAFRHEVAAQYGQHISVPAADDLLTLADALIADLESNPVPKAADVTGAIESIRSQVIAYRASGDIDNNGIKNSLLVKLNKGDQANNGSSGDLQTTIFTYDANGNRVNKEFPGPQGPKVQGTDYGYDPENRLIEALDYQGNTNGNRAERGITTLDYDGNGRRLAKVYDPKEGGGGAKRVEYVFDGLDPVAEYNIWNPQYDNFYRGDLGRMMSVQHFPSGTQGQMFWYHYDGLGSTAGLTKQNGQSTHNYRYEPYGQIEVPPGNFTDPHNHYTFTGQEWDENMDLYEFYARAYDPMTGVWLQQDVYRGRLQEPGTLHRYGYVENDPINLTDYYGYNSQPRPEYLPFVALTQAEEGYVRDAADEFGLPPEFVAAVIVAEKTHDYTLIDVGEDNFAKLAIRLQDPDILLNNVERLAGHRNPTLGLGQVSLETARRVDEFVAGQCMEEETPVLELIKRLEDPKTNIWYVAGYLKLITEQEEFGELTHEMMREIYARRYRGNDREKGFIYHGDDFSFDVVEYYKKVYN